MIGVVATQHHRDLTRIWLSTSVVSLTKAGEQLLDRGLAPRFGHQHSERAGALAASSAGLELARCDAVLELLAGGPAPRGVARTWPCRHRRQFPRTRSRAGTGLRSRRWRRDRRRTMPRWPREIGRAS